MSRLPHHHQLPIRLDASTAAPLTLAAVVVGTLMLAVVVALITALGA